MRINQNTAAFNAYRNLSVTNDQQAKSLEKLSSGFRINRAADDAAGLSISEGLRSQIGGLKQGSRNAQDGISVVQTAEGALTETHSILQRMRDLSVQGANSGSLNASALGNIQAEVVQLKSELDRIASTTQFNGKKLLDGSYSSSFQVGANVGETISVGISTAGVGLNSTGLGVAGVDVTGATGLAAVYTNPIVGTAGNVALTNATSLVNGDAWSTVKGTISIGGKSLDLGSLTFDLTATAGAGTTNLATLNGALDGVFGAANVNAAVATVTLTITGAIPAAATGSATDELAAAAVNYSAPSGATGAITLLDSAIQTVSTQRANLGAIQNRFDHTINNLNVATENLSASESRIRDTDMAMEMTNFSKWQILQQAGTAMLAQANQVPQGVLQLLRG